ncbi:MAG: hypothetical protein M5U22_07085 [Thermoleophilia bacterium]|nr:hypothetical protein [Thermoleophilia bacterium]
MLAEDLEKAIEKYYQRIQPPKKVIERLAKDFGDELLARQSNTIDEQQFITRRMARLADQRKRLTEAYYHGAIPIEVLKAEQTRITGELDDCQSRLEVLKEGRRGYQTGPRACLGPRVQLRRRLRESQP